MTKPHIPVTVNTRKVTRMYELSLTLEIDNRDTAKKISEAILSLLEKELPDYSMEAEILGNTRILNIDNLVRDLENHDPEDPEN